MGLLAGSFVFRRARGKHGRNGAGDEACGDKHGNESLHWGSPLKSWAETITFAVTARRWDLRREARFFAFAGSGPRATQRSSCFWTEVCQRIRQSVAGEFPTRTRLEKNLGN